MKLPEVRENAKYRTSSSRMKHKMELSNFHNSPLIVQNICLYFWLVHGKIQSYLVYFRKKSNLSIRKTLKQEYDVIFLTKRIVKHWDKLSGMEESKHDIVFLNQVWMSKNTL